jgi:hypothetical protein
MPVNAKSRMVDPKQRIVYARRNYTSGLGSDLRLSVPVWQTDY